MTLVPDLDVLAVGESMVVLTAPAGARLIDAETLEVHTAGAESNVAVHLAQVGYRAAWIGRVGADPLGERVVESLASLGVDVSGVETDLDRPTGVYFKDFDGVETAVHYYRSGSAASRISLDPVLPALRRTQLLHLSGITAALSAQCQGVVRELMQRAQQWGVTNSFDVNYRPQLWSVAQAGPVLAELARLADIVFVGRDEAQQVWGVSTPAELRCLLPDVSTIVVKDGATGATALAGSSTTFVPAPKVTVVEPVGAGDAFAAGYLWGHLIGEPETARLRRGHLTAAVALRSVADYTELPSREWFSELCSQSDREWEALDLQDTSGPMQWTQT